ncbi:MAG TPA: folylpolyglutamate synthase/dihydrofolate synthase family protein [Syntrophorhabdaceae bacterium]|nr:folylpolyglutamate synthase/dihydrofolate synthase family protein [Syntrophorhabdaceae bacterium]HQM81670.1 folylpolyglutamate synthase/dihydrofolate synthase family protein [Syntrophorhabdaceae bacterium]
MREYSATLEYLYGLEKFGMVFGLENISWILNIMGNPHKALKTVHIAGTNGKGSVAAMIAGMLSGEGYSVGLYTSPHLVSFTERIAVSGEEIREEEVVELTERLRDKIEKKDKNRFFTFFDFTTAIAFEYFREKKVDIAVIETGLGGRLDSTNVIEPLVSVITNIAFDHTAHLGNTIEAIAREKAGIIKKGVPVVTGAAGVPLDIICEVAKGAGSSVYSLGRDFSYEKTGEQAMSYRGPSRALMGARVGMKGDHQLSNSAVALCAVDVLSTAGFPVNDGAILGSLSRIRCRGRLEELGQRPTVLIDGAHNPSGIHVLTEFIKARYAGRKKILIFGVMKDKEYDRMLQEIVPSVDMTILTKPAVERALEPSLMKTYAQDAIIAEDTRDALRTAKTLSGEDGLILVTGSFYTIGEAKAAMHDIF